MWRAVLAGVFVIYFGRQMQTWIMRLSEGPSLTPENQGAMLFDLTMLLVAGYFLVKYLFKRA